MSYLYALYQRDGAAVSGNSSKNCLKDLEILLERGYPLQNGEDNELMLYPNEDGELTIQFKGLYKIEAYLKWSSAGAEQLQVKKNGVLYRVDSQEVSLGSTTNFVRFMTELSANDKITFYAFNPNLLISKTLEFCTINLEFILTIE